ncbi:MAG: transketolase C-terminal domain-containing protein [Candidatus Gracilibacteria bacterium]|nr:transketolase C-terminal domain-containing protein [Candidatus Gracilibacteria bacterium]
MRNTVINKVGELMKNDENIFLLTADLGYGVFDEVIKLYPERCLNVGIAEQNMIGIASGLALSGKKVFCYSIVPFVTMRCYEQIRVDICTHNLDVTLIGIGGGFAYGTLGNTHYGLEDINLMRGLPNMRIFSPSDKVEIEVGFNILQKEKSPTYIRLNRGGEENVHNIGDINKNDIINGVEITDGKNLIIFSTGQITMVAKEVAIELQKEGMSAKVISIPFIKPINVESILKHIEGFDKVVTLEEHTIIGGLGSVISEIIAENNINVNFKRLGIKDKFFYLTGNQEYMRTMAGIDKNSVLDEIKILLKS